jgi:hypothetical protein
MRIPNSAMCAAVALLLVPASARAVMRDHDFEGARRDAMHHAQVQITKIAVPASTPGQCRVWGDVVRIFKGATRYFRLGDGIEFDVSCQRRNDLIPTGDTHWLDVTQLQDARFIETYLNSYRAGSGFDYRIPAWQYRLIDGISSTPACPDTTKGPRCAAFNVPTIDVGAITRNISVEETAIRVSVPDDILTRLRVVAAQRSRRNQFSRISVADVVADLVKRHIDELEADVR